jgi:hypothetical protein
MQIFLPYPDFVKTAKCLDPKRLNNQINESLIIYRTITGYYPKGKGWSNHPVAKMWAGYDSLLLEYRNALIVEYESRTNKKRNGVGIFWEKGMKFFSIPPFIGHPDFHREHRSQLLQKDYAHYSRFGWKEKPGEYPYDWERWVAMCEERRKS